jgi:hypothetical protein
MKPRCARGIAWSAAGAIALTLTACGAGSANHAPAAAGSPTQPAGTNAASSGTSPEPSDTASSTAAGCALATVGQISAAAGRSMKVVLGAGDNCAYSAVDDPSFALEATAYEDTSSMATITSIESSSEHLTGLGDDAFWNGTVGAVFVRKGTRGFSFSLPSFANLTDAPAAVQANMVALATAVAARF